MLLREPVFNTVIMSEHGRFVAFNGAGLLYDTDTLSLSSMERDTKLYIYCYDKEVDVKHLKRWVNALKIIMEGPDPTKADGSKTCIKIAIEDALTPYIEEKIARDKAVVDPLPKKKKAHIQKTAVDPAVYGIVGNVINSYPLTDPMQLKVLYIYCETNANALEHITEALEETADDAGKKRFYGNVLLYWATLDNGERERSPFAPVWHDDPAMLGKGEVTLTPEVFLIMARSMTELYSINNRVRTDGSKAEAKRIHGLLDRVCLEAAIERAGYKYSEFKEWLPLHLIFADDDGRVVEAKMAARLAAVERMVAEGDDERLTMLESLDRSYVKIHKSAFQHCTDADGSLDFNPLVPLGLTHILYLLRYKIAQLKGADYASVIASFGLSEERVSAQIYADAIIDYTPERGDPTKWFRRLKAQAAKVDGFIDDVIAELKTGAYEKTYVKFFESTLLYLETLSSEERAAFPISAIRCVKEIGCLPKVRPDYAVSFLSEFVSRIAAAEPSSDPAERAEAVTVIFTELGETEENFWLRPYLMIEEEKVILIFKNSYDGDRPGSDVMAYKIPLKRYATPSLTELADLPFTSLAEFADFPEALLSRTHIKEDEYLNQGLGTEAFRLWLDYQFANSDCHRIGAETWSFNPRAIRIVEKTGFLHEGTSRELREWQGKRIDKLHFGMLRKEWEERR
ncbi:MAG: GNAT family N-acetyltransferase [Calditrichaeota bacterium]|nr:GNAT family N-acetyltransferase [Calditrichota bacterium]